MPDRDQHEIDHYVSEPRDQALHDRLRLTESTPGTSVVTRATNFRGIVDLLRRAEVALVRAGQADPEERATTLRGIYYGTEWSLDYLVESSELRNVLFLVTTGAIPADPRPALSQQLFSALQRSQSINDHGRQIDIGHVLIGLDTRARAATRAVPIPGQGGTGLEIVTWLGDLGGGAANLAFRRVTNPGTNVLGIFHNSTSDYGATDNLEGDIGGYLVACGETPGGAPVYAKGKLIADLLEAYLPVGDGRQWSTRVARFATCIGATVSAEGIQNTASLVNLLTPKLYDIAVSYMLTRYVGTGKLRGKAVIAACQHLRGAASEVAAVFVQALSHAIVKQGRPVAAVRPYPRPSSPGPCQSRLLNPSTADVLQRLFQ